MRFVAAGLQLRVQFALTALCLVLAPTVALAQPRAAGKATYRQFCARCHGADGRGGEMGPGIVARAGAAKPTTSLARSFGGHAGERDAAVGAPDGRNARPGRLRRTFRGHTEDAPARLSVTSDEGPLQGVALNAVGDRAAAAR